MFVFAGNIVSLVAANLLPVTDTLCYAYVLTDRQHVFHDDCAIAFVVLPQKPQQRGICIHTTLIVVVVNCSLLLILLPLFLLPPHHWLLPHFIVLVAYKVLQHNCHNNIRIAVVVVVGVAKRRPYGQPIVAR